jgi:hypothetical protein
MLIAAHYGSVLATAISTTPSLTAAFQLRKEPEQRAGQCPRIEDVHVRTRVTIIWLP